MGDRGTSCFVSDAKNEKLEVHIHCFSKANDNYSEGVQIGIGY